VNWGAVGGGALLGLALAGLGEVTGLPTPLWAGGLLGAVAGTRVRRLGEPMALGGAAVAASVVGTLYLGRPEPLLFGLVGGATAWSWQRRRGISRQLADVLARISRGEDASSELLALAEPRQPLGVREVARYNLGLLAAGRGQWGEAIRWLSGASRPSVREYSLVALALSLAGAGKNEDAGIALRKLRSATGVVAAQRRAVEVLLLWRKGERDEAMRVADAQRAVGAPNLTLVLLAAMRLESGDRGGAGELLAGGALDALAGGPAVHLPEVEAIRSWWALDDL